MCFLLERQLTADCRVHIEIEKALQLRKKAFEHKQKKSRTNQLIIRQ
jgi:hypothetical protein